MKATTTIGTLALLASATAAQADAPAKLPVLHNACLEVEKAPRRTNGVWIQGGCDETPTNERFNRPLLKNGCAEGQIQVVTAVRIASCPLPMEL